MARNLVNQLLAAQARYVSLAADDVDPREDELRGTPVSSVWRD
jgi:hypothetical protein